MSFIVKITETDFFNEKSVNELFEMSGAPSPKQSWEVDFLCPELYNFFINNVTRDLKILSISLSKILTNHNINWEDELPEIIKQVENEISNGDKHEKN